MTDSNRAAYPAIQQGIILFCWLNWLAIQEMPCLKHASEDRFHMQIRLMISMLIAQVRKEQLL